MQLSVLDNILWAAGFFGNICLLFVLLIKRRWRQFPIFTILIAYYIAENIVLFWAYRRGTRELYDYVYWITFTIEILLQLALIFEIARIVLRPTGTWVQDARSTFLLWGLLGAFIAFGLTFVVKPTEPTGYGAWGVRAYLFTSLLFCELFLAMMFAAQKLGLVWRNHVMGLGQGLALWALVSAFIDTAHSYLGSSHLIDFKLLEHIRSLAIIAAQSYWIIIFWLPEPERRPLSPDMQKYLVALHQKVQYDATQVSSAPNSR
ncbi:MAG TPA: hypothetical protein VHT24_07700 [Pseudacidobacterium sp.]|jgi:hypothetical protein|nr:hypothetical protein [Pseudacidobacterium sp.]